MPWTIESALDDEAIEKSAVTAAGYSLWLKGIPIEVRVLIAICPEGGYNFYLSHSIHTPLQAHPYQPSRPWGDYEAYALHRAIDAITSYYKSAVGGGHSPSADWLVPNDNPI